MTPETLRGAVAAAIAGRPLPHGSSRGSTAERFGKPEIETLTLNGFQIRSEDAPSSPSSFEHRFRVSHARDGVEFPVTVAIDPEAVARVVRLTQRQLEPGGAFWRLQAERLLAAYLWSEGKGPADGRLTVHDVSREELEVAVAWKWD